MSSPEPLHALANSANARTETATRLEKPIASALLGVDTELAWPLKPGSAHNANARIFSLDPDPPLFGAKPCLNLRFCSNLITPIDARS